VTTLALKSNSSDRTGSSIKPLYLRDIPVELADAESLKTPAAKESAVEIWPAHWVKFQKWTPARPVRSRQARNIFIAHRTIMRIRQKQRLRSGIGNRFFPA